MGNRRSATPRPTSASRLSDILMLGLALLLGAPGGLAPAPEPLLRQLLFLRRLVAVIELFVLVARRGKQLQRRRGSGSW